MPFLLHKNDNVWNVILSLDQSYLFTLSVTLDCYSDLFALIAYLAC